MSDHSDYLLSLSLAVLLGLTCNQLRAHDTECFGGKEPGQELNRNSLEMPFCWCPPGKFVMGSPLYEAGRIEHEEQVFVTLSSGFWMGKFEVTQDQWQRVMDSHPSKFRGATLPVESVSWNDTVSFCEEFSKRERERGNLPEGWEYRLPTEAQWAFACRAGSSLPYCFGDDLDTLDEYAWRLENSEGKTHAVGQKKANRWGLHDMHGNVWEWCRDHFQVRLAGGRDPEATHGSARPRRVFRGGGWNRVARLCRSAYRSSRGQSYRYSSLGFRVSIVPVSEPEKQAKLGSER